MKQITRPTIATRLTQSEIGEVDQICQLTGQSRSDWLHKLVQEALGKHPVHTVQAMSDRLKAIEDRLARLAR